MPRRLARGVLEPDHLEFRSYKWGEVGSAKARVMLERADLIPIAIAVIITQASTLASAAKTCLY